MKTKSPFQMFLSFVSFFAKTLSNQGHCQWQYVMVSLGSALLDLQLSAFWICSKYLKETVKDRYSYVLNITIYICHKTFFLICKAMRQKNQKQSWKKNAHTELSGENSLTENSTYYTHIDWLLINSMANVVYLNFLSHNVVVNISTK